ncbi:MAG: DUF4422 domain-containing protein [Lachnospiraceae bacterium]|nr:DUF4422 domain-containing protein [Lachnospiraceae bacterium]
MNLAIYGAKGYALSACKAIKTLYPRREISNFLVTRMDGNAPILGGIPVKTLVAYAGELSREEKQQVEILIATPDQVQPEIEEILENFGFRCHRRLTFARWEELMKLFYAKAGSFLPLPALPVGCHMPFVRIYMAKSHVDKPLRGNAPLPEYVFPIQVGAECCDLRVANLLDNTGEHISGKNGNYCELTALYWMWKNKLTAGDFADGEEGQYFGLCQYRRGFDFSEDDLLRLADNDVDVVLPYPLPYEPSIHAHHERYIREVDWNAMLQALEELQPEYAQVFSRILGQQYLYNYNVVLAKKSVLRDYCAWLFPILERTEELSAPKGCERSDRYIGYMGETLETLYFMKNAERLTIVHAGCRLLV